MDKPLFVAITRHYVVEKFRKKPKDAMEYRTKVIYDKHGYRHVAKIAIVKHEGPRHEHTVLTSLWHPKKEPKAKSVVKKAFQQNIPVYVIKGRKKIRLKSFTQAKEYLREW